MSLNKSSLAIRVPRAPGRHTRAAGGMSAGSLGSLQESGPSPFKHARRCRKAHSWLPSDLGGVCSKCGVVAKVDLDGDFEAQSDAAYRKREEARRSRGHQPDNRPVPLIDVGLKREAVQRLAGLQSEESIGPFSRPLKELLAPPPRKPLSDDDIDAIVRKYSKSPSPTP